MLCTIAVLFGVLYTVLPTEVSVFGDEREKLNTPLYTLIPENANSAETVLKNQSAYSNGQYSARIKILGLLPIKTVTIDVFKRQELVLGGQTFGIRLYTQGVIVVGCGNFIYQGKNVNPASEAGIRIGDRLIHANGQTLTSNEQLQQIVLQSTGPIEFTVVRKNMKFTTTVTPIIPDADSGYRLGLWVRDSTAGIGTLTYFNRTTGNFAGLGHAVADVDTGEIMPSAQGTICKTDITEIVKSNKGEAGQLSGKFLNENYGRLLANTEEGIFAKCEMTEFENEKTVPFALKSEIKIGPAQIYTQLDNDAPQYYDIRIEKIHNNLSENKNMVIKVTDPKLLKQTGGIVQGMSGSPIVQNGKLIGAVTHVFIDDPTRGYGIFIEKMLISENEIKS